MFSMTDVFIDDIAASKRNILRCDGFSGIGAVIGPWFGGVLLDYYGTVMGCSIFSTSYIFNCGISCAFSYKRFIEKRYDRNSNIEMHVES